MRYWTVFFIWIGIWMAGPVWAQQWEHFNVPHDPISNTKLRAIQGNVYFVGWDGLYRSVNGGDNWQRIRDYQPAEGFQLFEVNRYNNRLYFTEGLDTSGIWQLFTSTNLGDSWSLIGNCDARQLFFIGDTICKPGINNELQFKIGSSPWQNMPSWPADTAGNIIDCCSEGQKIWVATEKGVYRSQDGGLAWELNLPISDVVAVIDPNHFFNIQIEVLNGEVVLIDQIKDLIWYSSDSGNTWQEGTWKGIGLQNSGKFIYAMDSTDTQLLRFNGGSPLNWQVIPLDAQSKIIMNGIGEFNGAYWLGSHTFGVIRKKPDSDLWLPEPGDNPYSGYTFRYWDGHLFLDNIAQSFSTDNGATWHVKLNTTFPSGVWRNGNYDYMIGYNGNSRTIFRSLRNGRYEWVPYAPIHFGKGLCVMGDTLLGLDDYVPATLHRSIDNGLSWTTIPAPFPSDMFGIGITRKQNKFYFKKGKTIYRSDDLGDSWQSLYTFPGNIEQFYIVGDTFLVSHPATDMVFFSTDDGQSFDTLTVPEIPSTSFFRFRTARGLLLLDQDDNLLHVSRDMGANWQTIVPPSDINFSYIINNSKWAYGDNTLFFPGYWKLRLDGQRQVTGQIFVDINGNGQQDANESGVNGLIIKDLQSDVLSNSYGDGNFSMLLNSNPHTLALEQMLPHYSVAPLTVEIPAGTDTVPDIAFALQPQELVNDASLHLVPASSFRAGYDNTLHLTVKNTGTLPSSGQIKLLPDPLLTILNTIPAAEETSGDTLIWNYNNLAPLTERKIRVEINTAVVPPDTPVSVWAGVETQADVDPTNNVVSLNELVVSSFDPNDKSVSKTEIPAETADSEELTYTIRFQNLGNIETDFITVRDTLSDALDAASVRVLAASHFYEWSIEEVRILVFRFNPIHLTPANVDSLRSQGFVQFAARLKPDLQPGDEISNTAHIYFDFNPAVVTNTVVSSIQVVSTFEPWQIRLPLEIFPNPASSVATIRIPVDIRGGGTLEIFSASGILLQTALVSGNAIVINLQHFSSGAYWCRWSIDEKVFWGKLMIQK